MNIKMCLHFKVTRYYTYIKHMLIVIQPHCTELASQLSLPEPELGCPPLQAGWSADHQAGVL